MEAFGGLPVASLAAGKTHSAGVLASGEAFTWGEGSEGKLGHGGTGTHRQGVCSGVWWWTNTLLARGGCAAVGATASRSPPPTTNYPLHPHLTSVSPADSAYVPQCVQALAGRVHVTGAALGRQHTLFLDASGQAWATGENKEGQCGLGTPLEELARQQRQQWEVGALVNWGAGGNGGLAAAASAPAAASQQRGGGGGGAAGWGAPSYEQQQFDRNVEYFSQHAWASTNLKPFLEHRERSAQLDAAMSMCALPCVATAGCAAAGCERSWCWSCCLLGLLPRGACVRCHCQPLRLRGSLPATECFIPPPPASKPACRYDSDLKGLIARESAWQRFESAKGSGERLRGVRHGWVRGSRQGPAACRLLRIGTPWLLPARVSSLRSQGSNQP